MGVDGFNEAGIRRQGQALASLRDDDFRSLLLDPRTVALTPDMAKRLSLPPGATITVIVNGRPETLKVAALLDPVGPARTLGIDLALMDIAPAQEFLGKVGRLDRIDLVLRGESPEELQRLRDILPPGATLFRTAEQRQGTERMVRSYQLNLLAMSFIAVLVSMYLIYHVTSLAVVRRRHDLGVLRSLGLLPHQVRLLILGESVGYGLVGGLLGIVGGVFLARLLLQTVAQTITDLYVLVGTSQIVLKNWEVPVFLSLSVLATVISAAVPARQAGRLQPREILTQRRGSLAPPRFPDRLQAGIGLALLLLTAALLPVPAWRGLPLAALLATLTLILGFSLLLAPGTRKLLTRPPGRRPPADRRPGAVRLGFLYFRHSLDKMAVSMAALMTAIAMLISVALMIRSFRQTVEHWIDQSISGDLLVGPVLPSHQGDFQFLESAVIRGLETGPEIKDIYYYRVLVTHTAGSPVRLWTGNLDVIQRHGRLAFTAGDPDTIFRKTLTEEAVLVSEVLSYRLKIRPGDAVTLPTAHGPQAFQVAGIFYDYRTEGGGIWMDRRVFLKWWEDDRINGVRLYLKDPSRLNQVRESLLREQAGRYTLAIVSHRELRGQILAIFDQTFRVTYALEAIAILVAFLGIIHTSSILNLFRAKELGILKALGARPGQVRGLLLTETVLMGFFSFLWGAVAGTLLSLILIFVINKQSFGWTIQLYWTFQVYWQTLAVIVVSSVLAGWVPATVALKTDIQQLTREE
jgi:putative ABC transport system permease protein